MVVGSLGRVRFKSVSNLESKSADFKGTHSLPSRRNVTNSITESSKSRELDVSPRGTEERKKYTGIQTVLQHTPPDSTPSLNLNLNLKLNSHPAFAMLCAAALQFAPSAFGAQVRDFIDGCAAVIHSWVCRDE